jgi:thioredoxin reductase (NADPH)
MRPTRERSIAGQAVMNFSRYAAKVTMLIRGKSLSATLSHYLVDRITTARNVEVLYHSEVIGLDGENSLHQITIRNKQDGNEKTLGANRLFICIGGIPNTEWAKAVGIMRDSADYLVTGPDLLAQGNRPECWTRPRDPFHLETSVPGCFAAGDVRHNSVKRVASAVGEGAMAVAFVHRYLDEIQ